MQFEQEIEENQIQDQQFQMHYEGQNDMLDQQAIKNQYLQKKQQSLSQLFWKPVKMQLNSKKSKLKLQNLDDGINLNTSIKRRTQIPKKFSDPEQSKNYLIKLAKDYHKQLFQQVRERQINQQKEGVKTQAEWITADKNIRLFPLFKKLTQSQHFESIDKFKQILKYQEAEIVKQIDQNIVSVFYDSFVESIKNKSENKSFHNFKCKISGCKALLKCSAQNEGRGCVLYHVNNKHNHTITGKILEPGNVKIETPIILDEQLHQLFGFNKGVRSQTRDIRYQNPRERKLKVGQQKLESKLRQKKIKEENLTDGDFRQEQGKLGKRRQSEKKNRRKKLTNNRINNSQFKNMYSELVKQGFIVQTLQKFMKNQLMELSVITKQQLVRHAAHSNTLRFIMANKLIKLNRNQNQQLDLWSVMLVTILNQAMKPIVVAICLSTGDIYQNFPSIFQLIRKIFPQPEFVVSEYNRSVLQYLNKIKEQNRQRFIVLLDENDILNSLKKQFVNEKHIQALKTLMNLANCTNWNKIEKYLTKKCQNKALQEFLNFKQYTLIGNQKVEGFCGFQIDLSPERELMIKMKQRLRNGVKRHSLKLQLQNIMQFIYISNQQNNQARHLEQILQIQKIHKDNQLYFVRKNITPFLLNIFYLQYVSALQLDMKEQGGKYLFEKGKVFVALQLCSCKYFLVTGIPCKHMIRFLKQKKLSYVSRFNKRWLLTRQFSNKSQDKDKQPFKEKNLDYQNEKTQLDSEQQNISIQISHNMRQTKQISQSKTKRIKKQKSNKLIIKFPSLKQ